MQYLVCCTVLPQIRQVCFGGINLKLASSLEDLAYATYVMEYNSGNFRKAKHQAERALSILGQLLPSNHLLLSSAQRVLALIIEEIAIEKSNQQRGQMLTKVKIS